MFLASALGRHAARCLGPLRLVPIWQEERTTMTLLETEETTLTFAEPPACETVGELVCAAQQGDRAAFGRLVERFERSVFATAMRRLRNYAEAQELTQEVFVQA